MVTPREKLQGLLKKLFQFDRAELDFGIYRIMNQKRFIISATPYDDLRKKHGPEWNKSKYAEAHLLFFDQDKDNSYLQTIVAG